MRSDVVIEIFGRVSDPDAVMTLAEAAADEGLIDWDSQVEPDELVGLLEEASDNGRALTLTRSDTTNWFLGVREACRQAGLSYVVSGGMSGAEGFSSGLSRSPEMDEEFHFELSDDAASVKVSEVAKAARLGIEAVNELVERLTTGVKVGRIELEPGFIEAYEALAADKKVRLPAR
mgnify:FL=1